MRKKNEISEVEQNEFQKAMRGVKKISHTKITTPALPVKRTPKKTDDNQDTIAFSDYEKLPPVGSEEIIHFSRPGLQHKILRKLKQGQYNIDFILDLHGMTAEEAKQALSQCLLSCEQQNKRHLLIIHGKGHGKPVLKNKLNLWLRQTEQVLAFCSATQHGRGGALYVLLKRS